MSTLSSANFMDNNIVLKERTHSITTKWNYIFSECLWIN